MPYSDRLAHLNLLSLELRRLHLDLFFCYKVVFGLECIDSEELFTLRSVSQTRGHAITQLVETSLLIVNASLLAFLSSSCTGTFVTVMIVVFRANK